MKSVVAFLLAFSFLLSAGAGANEIFKADFRYCKLYSYRIVEITHGKKLYYRVSPSEFDFQHWVIDYSDFTEKGTCPGYRNFKAKEWCGTSADAAAIGFFDSYSKYNQYNELFVEENLYPLDIYSTTIDVSIIDEQSVNKVIWTGYDNKLNYIADCDKCYPIQRKKNVVKTEYIVRCICSQLPFCSFDFSVWYDKDNCIYYMNFENSYYLMINNQTIIDTIQSRLS